jgi:hypothetical protein
VSPKKSSFSVIIAQLFLKGNDPGIRILQKKDNKFWQNTASCVPFPQAQLRQKENEAAAAASLYLELKPKSAQ